MVSRRTFLKAAGGLGAWAVVPKPVRDLATHVSPPPNDAGKLGPPWTAPDRYVLRSVSVDRATPNQPATMGAIALSTRKRTLATWQARTGTRHYFPEPIVLDKDEQVYLVSSLRPSVTTLRFDGGNFVNYTLL